MRSLKLLLQILSIGITSSQEAQLTAYRIWQRLLLLYSTEVITARRCRDKFHITVKVIVKWKVIIVIVIVTEYNANRSKRREAQSITKNHRLL